MLVSLLRGNSARLSSDRTRASERWFVRLSVEGKEPSLGQRSPVLPCIQKTIFIQRSTQASSCPRAHLGSREVSTSLEQNAWRRAGASSSGCFGLHLFQDAITPCCECQSRRRKMGREGKEGIWKSYQRHPLSLTADFWKSVFDDAYLGVSALD